MLVNISSEFLKEYMRKVIDVPNKFFDIILEYYENDICDFEYADEVFDLMEFEYFCSSIEFITLEDLKNSYPEAYNAGLEQCEDSPNISVEDMFEDFIDDGWFEEYSSCLFVYDGNFCVFKYCQEVFMSSLDKYFKEYNAKIAIEIYNKENKARNDFILDLSYDVIIPNDVLNDWYNDFMYFDMFVSGLYIDNIVFHQEVK